MNTTLATAGFAERKEIVRLLVEEVVVNTTTEEITVRPILPVDQTFPLCKRSNNPPLRDSRSRSGGRFPLPTPQCAAISRSSAKYSRLEPVAGASPVTGHDPSCRTIYRLNAPVDNPVPTDLPEIEVTDPTHPLFGRRFPVVSRTSSPLSPGYVLVAYRQYMLLRIPVRATSLSPSLPVHRTKLTLEAVRDLVTLATQCEVLCPPVPTMSGPASRPNSKHRSLKN